MNEQEYTDALRRVIESNLPIISLAIFVVIDVQILDLLYQMPLSPLEANAIYTIKGLIAYFLAFYVGSILSSSDS